MENNNGKGIFYGVIGVATLIVAIIGATFAYFSATTASTEYVQGAAATASLGVHVDRLTSYSKGEGATSSNDAKYVMVPQLDEGISQAIRGTSVSGVVSADNNTACIDDNGSLVCSIYKITVQNTGSAAINVSADLNFYGTTNRTESGDGVSDENTSTENGVVTEGNNLLNHLKWARLEDPTALTTLLEDTDDNGTTFAEIDAIKAIPNTLFDYTDYATGNGVYQTLADGTTFAFGNYSDPNIYLYGMDVTVPAITEAPFKDLQGGDDVKNAARNKWVDLLGGSAEADPLQVWSHKAYTDLIDPTTDLKLDTTGGTNTYVKDTTDDKVGQWHLEAFNQTGDTKVFYIVVWISENLQEQNAVDFGQFTGQVTFRSAGGSGATSTFTEAYVAG